ncbi:MAG: PAS domain S-box protein [Syntrophales bacterium]|jgi:PAS domain S-box-containing protein|nr:PAS domain S-box protein [Syntrophales bacterium]MCK9391343.1 PAS domain S-box protein [Syntrophales bacterium]
MISRSDSITRTSSVLTAIISLVIAISIPAGYFMITYQYMGGSANAEIAFSAKAIESLVSNNPNSWQFEEIRLQEILERRIDRDNREKRIIRDMQGQIIAQTNEPLSNSMLTFSQPIYDSGIQVALIEIKRSISPLVARTAIISACSVLSGIMIFLFFRTFPLQAVRRAYHDLEENEQRLALALKSGNFGVWDWDINKNVIIWDDRMYEIYGVSRDSAKVVIEAWQNSIHSEDRDMFLEEVQTGILGEKPYNTEFRIEHTDGTVRYIKANGIVIRDMDGKPSRMIGLNRDITGRKRVDKTLLESEERYRTLVENASDIVFRTDDTGHFTYVNPAGLRVIGYQEEELIGKHYPIFIRPDMRDEAIKFFGRQFVKGIKNTYTEYPVLTKEGHELWFGQNTQSIVEDGHLIGFQAVSRDITDRKLAEEKVRASLLEKDILLGEIHHRVKNNMQVISGLLDLQARSSGNAELTGMLNESQSRIRSMALVHEKLYGSKDFSRIDLTGYVRTLSKELFQLHKINPGEIDMIVQTADGGVYVDINKAIPCGLILNELISNVLKHAFPGDGPSELRIIIHETKNREIEIVVRDNGLGLPDDVDIHQPRTGGLYLVYGLVQNQLGGQIEVRQGAGTEFWIKFPL